MKRFDLRARLLAMALSWIAGYVDAIGFLKLGGFFVSFMSGNSTRLAVGVVNGMPSVFVAGGLIGGFVIGVMVGTLIGHFGGYRRETMILATIGIMLGIAPLLNEAGLTGMSFLAMTLAMGAENTVFAQDGEIRVGVTYMTGTLVKCAQGLMLGFLRDGNAVWRPYLMLWLALIVGAISGSFSYAHFALHALWLAAAIVAILSSWSLPAMRK